MDPWTINLTVTNGGKEWLSSYLFYHSYQTENRDVVGSRGGVVATLSSRPASEGERTRSEDARESGRD